MIKSFRMTTDMARVQMKKMEYQQPNAQLEIADYDKGILSKLTTQPELQPELFFKMKIIELLKHMDAMPLKQRLIVEWVHRDGGPVQAANKFIEMGDRGELPVGWAKMLFDSLLAAGEVDLHEKIHLNEADLGELLEHKRKMGKKHMEMVSEIGCKRARSHQALLSDTQGNYRDGSDMQIRTCIGFFDPNEDHSKVARSVEFREIIEQPKNKRRERSKWMAFIGGSGSGKTLLAKDIERNSLNVQKICINIGLASYTTNRMTSFREVSLYHLKSYADASDDVQDAAMKYLKDNQKSVYIIIDGLSQVEWEVNVNAPKLSSLNEKAKYSDILANLLTRKILPLCRIFFLCRPVMFNKLKEFPVTDVYTVGHHNMGC